jgi:hypothetical protein
MTEAIERVLAEISFDRDALVPAVAQQHDIGDVLMLAWMNRDAVRASPQRRPRLLLVALAPPVVAQRRDPRARSSCCASCGSTATAVRCCSWSTSRGWPALPDAAAAFFRGCRRDGWTTLAEPPGPRPRRLSRRGCPSGGFGLNP